MFTMMGAIYYREHDNQLIFILLKDLPLSSTVPLLFQAVKHHSATRSGIDMYGFHF